MLPPIQWFSCQQGIDLGGSRKQQNHCLSSRKHKQEATPRQCGGRTLHLQPKAWKRKVASDEVKEFLRTTFSKDKLQPQSDTKVNK